MRDREVDHRVLIVDRIVEFSDGSMVVAGLGGEFTLKRIFMKGNRVFLRPENDQFDPIEVTEDTDCEIWELDVVSPEPEGSDNLGKAGEGQRTPTGFRSRPAGSV